MIDKTCKHGVAMDVHCCNCHSGFIFDKDHVCKSVACTEGNHEWIGVTNGYYCKNCDAVDIGHGH